MENNKYKLIATGINAAATVAIFYILFGKKKG